MKIYLYDKETKEYLGCKEADADPAETKLQGKFVPLLPACSVLNSPPNYGENQIPVISEGEWQVVNDYRKNYCKADKDLNITPITTPGEQEGFYLVNVDDVSDIQKNPDKYKIANNIVVRKSDKEIREDLTKRRKTEFLKNFFKTSLGWIRRKVTMKNGVEKDFLSDILLAVKAGMEIGQNVVIITYKEPDFTLESDEKYLESLQEYKTATQEFIKECLMQTVNDFNYGKEV